ncbi:multidrug transporter [Candidatus Woesearchaeota archaeon CG11_big_fil_rev_8_21_14_0_20_43_8]|nr:MAG: multidrug transporter [Candidatus Woesearchaeota archaeon CG11_big_fil_rev_8_21_14_0_20_43_8]
MKITIRLLTVGLAVLATFIGSIGAIILKKGSDRIKLNIKALITNYHLILGIVTYVISAAIFILALRIGDLSFVYPLVATSYIWASLFSVRFLGEKMNKLKWIGIGIIIIGVTFIGMGS